MSPTLLLESLGAALRIKPVEEPVEKPLLAALAKLDIEPLNMKAVNTYKKFKLEKEFEILQQELRRRGWRPHIHGSQYAPLVREHLSKRGWTDADKYAFLCYDHPTIADPAGMATSYPTCIAMGWHRHAVSGAEKLGADVPEYVTRKAEAIKNEVPNVRMEVDGLESTTEQYDPFLVVKLGEEEYYVEVWGTDDRDFIR